MGTSFLDPQCGELRPLNCWPDLTYRKSIFQLALVVANALRGPILNLTSDMMKGIVQDMLDNPDTRLHELLGAEALITESQL